MTEGVVIYSGWLVKEGFKVKNWKYRFFVLFDDKLCYYRNEALVPNTQTIRNDVKPLGEIILKSGVTVGEAPERAKSKEKFVFKLITGDRCYYFQAKHEHMMTEWLNHIRQVLRYLNQNAPNIGETTPLGTTAPLSPFEQVESQEKILLNEVLSLFQDTPLVTNQISNEATFIVRKYECSIETQNQIGFSIFTKGHVYLVINEKRSVQLICFYSKLLGKLTKRVVNLQTVTRVTSRTDLTGRDLSFEIIDEKPLVFIFTNSQDREECVKLLTMVDTLTIDVDIDSDDEATTQTATTFYRDDTPTVDLTVPPTVADDDTSREESSETMSDDEEEEEIKPRISIVIEDKSPRKETASLPTSPTSSTSNTSPLSLPSTPNSRPQSPDERPPSMDTVLQARQERFAAVFTKYQSITRDQKLVDYVYCQCRLDNEEYMDSMIYLTRDYLWAHQITRRWVIPIDHVFQFALMQGCIVELVTHGKIINLKIGTEQDVESLDILTLDINKLDDVRLQRFISNLRMLHYRRDEHELARLKSDDQIFRHTSAKVQRKIERKSILRDQGQTLALQDLKKQLKEKQEPVKVVYVTKEQYRDMLRDRNEEQEREEKPPSPKEIIKDYFPPQERSGTTPPTPTTEEDTKMADEFIKEFDDQLYLVLGHFQLQVFNRVMKFAQRNVILAAVQNLMDASIEWRIYYDVRKRASYVHPLSNVSCVMLHDRLPNVFIIKFKGEKDKAWTLVAKNETSLQKCVKFLNELIAQRNMTEMAEKNLLEEINS